MIRHVGVRRYVENPPGSGRGYIAWVCAIDGRGMVQTSTGAWLHTAHGPTPWTPEHATRHAEALAGALAQRRRSA